MFMQRQLVLICRFGGELDGDLPVGRFPIVLVICAYEVGRADESSLEQPAVFLGMSRSYDRKIGLILFRVEGIAF